MDDLVPSAQECLGRIRELLTQGRRQALQAVNTAMVQTYWQIGPNMVRASSKRWRISLRMSLAKALIAPISGICGLSISLFQFSTHCVEN